MTTALPMFANHALSARLERAEATHLARGLELYAAHVRSLTTADPGAAEAPEPPPASLHVGGGVALFFGPRVSLSRTVGLGMDGPVASADIDALDAFYRARMSHALVLVSAHAHPTLFEQLGEHGYRLVELDTLLARRLQPSDQFAVPDGITVREARRDEAAGWVRVSLASFSDTGAPAPGGHPEIYEALFQLPTTSYFFAAIDGEIAGTAAVDLQSGTAQLFATSTRHGARGRGVQTALIAARLAFAQAAGCDLTFMRTEAGSGSQRNAERQGFRPLYSKAILEKRFD